MGSIRYHNDQRYTGQDLVERYIGNYESIGFRIKKNDTIIIINR